MKNHEPKKIIELRANGTKRVATENTGKTMTQQHLAKETDVNYIVAKFAKTGTVTHVSNAKSNSYRDLVNAPSYQEALQTIINAETLFMEIPAKIRAKFNNDPQQMITYLADPKNTSEAISLGLVVAPPPTQQTPVTDPPT